MGQVESDKSTNPWNVLLNLSRSRRSWRPWAWKNTGRLWRETSRAVRRSDCRLRWNSSTIRRWVDKLLRFLPSTFYHSIIAFLFRLCSSMSRQAVSKQKKHLRFAVFMSVSWFQVSTAQPVSSASTCSNSWHAEAAPSSARSIRWSKRKSTLPSWF